MTNLFWFYTKLKLLKQYMQNEIQANEHEGNFETYNSSKHDLIEEIKYHVEKLEEALLSNDTEKTNEYAADVANYMLKVIV